MGTMFKLNGDIAAVTGGASGIGLAAAKMLAEAGANVAILDINEESADKVAAIIPNAFGVGVDVASERSVEAAFDAVQERGTASILVNCAGIAIRREAVDLPLADWNKVVDVNMTGSFLTSRVAARHMMAAGIKGSIIQTSSIMGLSGGGIYPNVSYQATKGAIVNMTRALAVEWAPSGIRVNAVAPTYVRTPFIQPLLDQPDIMEKIFAMTPLRRLAEPEDVAAAVLFLASGASTMITGHCLPIDGGFLAQ